MVKVFNYENQSSQFSCNTYVVGKIGSSCIIIDLGSTDKSIYNYISTHYERVEAILLTHAHFDHIRGLPLFLKNFEKKNQVPIYLAKEDEELLKNPELNASFLTGENVQLNVTTIPIEDGEVLNFKAAKVEVIKTPFHTFGSVSYLLQDDNALFTGDTLMQGSIGRTDLKTSSPELVESSLNKIKLLNENLVIYPGHGPISTLRAELKNNPFLK